MYTPVFSVGLSTYYQRAAVAVATTQFTSVVLTLMSAEGDIVEHKRFDTEYVAPAEATAVG